MTGTIMRRILGVARFDRESYLWILWNDRAGGDAVLIVAITQLLITLGVVGLDLRAFLDLFISGMFFWLIYSGIAWAVANFLLDGHGAFTGVFRIAGFAFPTLLLIIFADYLIDAPWSLLAGSAWFVAVVAFGMKEAMEVPVDRGWLAAAGGLVGWVILDRIFQGLGT